MWRLGQSQTENRAGGAFVSSLNATGGRIASPALLFLLASMLLTCTTSAPIASAILQEGQGVCQAENPVKDNFLKVRK
jgi:hypothetical protein